MNLVHLTPQDQKTCTNLQIKKEMNLFIETLFHLQYRIKFELH